ncbi:MAG: tetratricopeptide repeat protein [Verrucomicrobiia bacterium]
MMRRNTIEDAPHPQAAVSSPAPETYFVRRPWLLALLLVAVTLIAYLPVWRAGFIWDDDYHVTANRVMTAPHGLWMIWTSLDIGRYYPLTLTTFWAERRLWGLYPLPYHLVNVLLHAASGVLLFFVLRRLRIPAPWLAAMVWALHPVNVESVAWITELKNTQSGFFFFSSLLCYLKFTEQKQLPHRWYRGYLSGLWYVCAAGCGTAAILSNATTAVLPLALLLVVWWERGHWERADAVRLSPYLGMAWLVSGLTIFEQRDLVLRASMAGWSLGFARRFVVAGKTIWFYAAKTLWPFRLTFVYPRWKVDASSWWSWVPLAAVVVVGIALWRCRTRAWCRAALFGGGFFLAALLPAMGFFDLFFFRYSFVADRFQYLACLGLISLAVSAGVAVCDRAGHWGRVSGPLAAAVVLLVLGVSTWRQALIYRNLETLWRDTLAKNPGCWLAHNNLGYVLSRAGRVSDAIGQYDQALRLDPESPEAQYGLALALEQAGRNDEAIAHFEQALRLKPDNAEAHANLGHVLSQEGRTSDAIGQYDQALRLDPDLPEAHYGLALALEQAGRTDEAVTHYEQAVRIKPENAEAHANLGYVLSRAGRVSDAIGQYDQALRLKPALAEAHYGLALALEQAGRTDEAIAHFERALRLKPDYAEAHVNLGSVLSMEGRTSDAIEQYEQALRITPGLPELHHRLAVALELAGRTDEAVAHYEQALRIKPDYPEAHADLAYVFWREGRISDAIRHYEQALRLNPDLAEAHYGLALALEQADRMEEAFAHYEQALWIKPDYDDAEAALDQFQAHQ